MKIVILRHGKPKINGAAWLTAAEFGQWIEDYSNAGLDSEASPPRDLRFEIESCSFVACSDLKRSIESAEALGVKCIAMRDSLFRECEMPHAQWSFVKFPAAIWAIAFRLLYVLGFHETRESFGKARERASLCEARLSELARVHDSIVLVGHGTMNWLIARRLVRMGWKEIRKAKGGYWGYGIYSRLAT